MINPHGWFMALSNIFENSATCGDISVVLADPATCGLSAIKFWGMDCDISVMPRFWKNGGFQECNDTNSQKISR